MKTSALFDPRSPFSLRFFTCYNLTKFQIEIDSRDGPDLAMAIRRGDGDAATVVVCGRGEPSLQEYFFLEKPRSKVISRNGQERYLLEFR